MTAPDQQPADLVIDGGDQRCVLLLLELRHRIQPLSDGTIVHLIATDPAAPLDLPAWCHLTGHIYLGAVQHPTDTRPTYAVQVRAGAHPTDPARPWRRT